ncbi:4-(cytidine 5'-diphospho)-2-C-methyl-D-erythritol kinase [Porphyromonadaceae bacterium]
MICFPNAKINIGLNIISKRTDGFHNLETVFYPIQLKDALEIVPTRPHFQTTLHPSGLVIESAPEDNLVLKAYQLFGQSYTTQPLDIYLHKTIPHGAGLGGGSADAAFMLKLLSTYHEQEVSVEDLETMASSIGADCSFFIKNKPVFAEGIGNIFTPIDLSLKGFFIVIIKPDVFVSTKEAYAMASPRKPERSIKELVQRPIEEWKSLIVNDFERSIFALHPIIGEIKEELYKQGAVFAQMSGSGSSVFGLFRKKPDIKTAQENFVWIGELK